MCSCVAKSIQLKNVDISEETFIHLPGQSKGISNKQVNLFILNMNRVLINMVINHISPKYGEIW